MDSRYLSFFLEMLGDLQYPIALSIEQDYLDARYGQTIVNVVQECLVVLHGGIDKGNLPTSVGCFANFGTDQECCSRILLQLVCRPLAVPCVVVDLVRRNDEHVGSVVWEPQLMVQVASEQASRFKNFKRRAIAFFSMEFGLAGPFST